MDRSEIDDDTGFVLALAERVGALEVEGAPGGGRSGRLVSDRLSPDQREDLGGQIAAELNRRHRSLDQAAAYVRGPDCRPAHVPRPLRRPRRAGTGGAVLRPLRSPRRPRCGGPGRGARPCAGRRAAARRG